MSIDKMWRWILFSLPVLLVLSAQPVYAQDDILDEIEAELKKEQEQKKAQEKADKNKEKYTKNYQVSVNKGDALLRAKKFDEAIAAYTEAKTWGPSETYPDNQIALAKQEKKRAEDKAKEEVLKEKYNAVIVKADAYFKSQKYAEAIAKYQEASSIKSDEVYPKDQIAEAKKLKAKKEDEAKKAEETARIEKEYTAAMSKGDAAMKSKDFDAAILAYESATKIKPSDPEPKSRKATAEKMKADEAKKLEQEAQQKKYDDLIKTADGLLGSSQFDQAKAKYEEASKVLPHETYPKTKMKECDDSKLAAAQAKLRAEYDALVKEADALVKSEQFDDAITKYEAAAKVLPHETHPKDMITQAQALKKQKADNEQLANFEKVLKEAEALIAAEKFDEGIAKLGEAHNVMPHETKTKELIAEANRLKEQKAADAIKQDYESKIKEGEELMNAEKFDEAIIVFEGAKKVLPSDHRAQSLIDQANSLKANKKQAALQIDFNAQIKAGEDFLKDDRFDEAIAAFEAAQRILPNDHKPATLITQANDLRKAKENEIAKAEYDELLAAGDKQLEEGKFDEARGSYKGALAAYAEGQSTVDARLSKVDIKEKEKLDAEKAEAEQKAKQEQFDKLVAEANGLVSSKDYEGAKQKIAKALLLFPDNQAAKSKQSEIDGLIAQAEKEKQEQLAAEAAAAAQAKKESEVKDFLSQAETKKSSGDLTGAKSLIASALAVIPNDPGATAAMKDIDVAISDYEKKLAEEKAAKEAAEKAEAEKKAKVDDLIKQGNVLLSSGSFAEAITKYDEALALDDNNSTALSKKGEAQKAKETKEQEQMAAEEREKAEKAKQDKINGLSAEAQSAESAENYDQAISKWKEVLAIDASSTSASNNITRLEDKKKEIAAALAAADAEEKRKQEEEAKKLAALEAEKSAQEKQAKVDGLIADANAAESAENYDGAIERWNQVIALDASNSSASSNITRLENKKKEVAAALAAADAEEKRRQEEEAKKLAALEAEKSAQEKQAKIDALSAEAKSAESAKNYDEAIEKWNQVIALDASNSSASSSITRIKNKKKEAASALAASQAAEKRKQEEEAKKQANETKKAKIELLTTEAQQAESSGNINGAINKWKEILAIDASVTVASTNISRLEGRKQKMEADKLAAEEAQRKRDEEAAKQQSEKERRNLIASYLEIGDKILAEKQYQKAIENYEKAEELDGDNLQIKSKISRAKELKADEDKRIAQLEASERQQEINVLLSEAKLLGIKRQYLESKEKYDQVLKYEPGNQRALDGLASIQKYIDELERKNAAEEARQKERDEIFRKVEAILDAGSDLYAGGQYKEALAKFKEGLEVDPLNHEVKASIRSTKQAIERQEQYRIARLHNLPRPKPKGFTTEKIDNVAERKDKTKFQNELGKSYPEGVTEEKRKEKRKDITRRVVVTEGVGSEYFKVHHDWGGIYYFNDGKSIDSYKWQYETRSPDQRSNP
ncbi:MAG: hypothetical protein CL840_11270 [Crocinitomicaceae bacterium]|nr:hypothetical protein [Crocinitomicaceae bacterium]